MPDFTKKPWANLLKVGPEQRGEEVGSLQINGNTDAPGRYASGFIEERSMAIRDLMASNVRRLMRVCLSGLMLMGGCGRTEPTRADELTPHKILSGGVERTYCVHQGKPSPKPLPLVVVLHGGGGNGKLLKDTYGFKPFVENGEMIAVYPDAIKGAWMPDDVAFIDAVIDEVFQRETVARERLFVTGASRGGLMTFVMAAKSKHPIRAAGTVIASQLSGLAREFPISRPIDFAMIAGTADPLMPYYGGWGAMSKPKTTGDPDGRVLPVEETIQLLLQANGIVGEPAVSSLGNADPNDGCTNEVRRWTNPETGARPAGESRGRRSRCAWR
jgi:polyhydroxybutyrate depolymerase